MVSSKMNFGCHGHRYTMAVIVVLYCRGLRRIQYPECEKRKRREKEKSMRKIIERRYSAAAAKAIFFVNDPQIAWARK